MAFKFLKYLALLFLVVFIADRALYFCIQKIQSSTFRGINGGKINDYMKQDTPPNLLIMGPSNAAYQLNPANFKTETYNLGHPDTEDAFQSALLSIIIQNKKIPKNILLHVTPDLYLGKDSVAGYTSKSPLKLGYYYSRNTLLTAYINDISFKERVKYLMGLTKYNNKIVSILKDFAATKIGGPVPKGFLSFTASDRDSINVVLDYERVLKERKNAAVKQDVVQKQKFKYLEKFILQCRENNINLILFTLPFYPDVARRKDIELADISMQNFAAKYNIKYFDFRQTDLIRIINKPSYWKDMQHLSERGSPLESEFVNNTIAPFLN